LHICRRSRLVRVGHAGFLLDAQRPRPQRRDAINAEAIAGIGERYRAAHADPAVRAIVLAAAGDKAFCAGADLQSGGAIAFDLSQPAPDYARWASPSAPRTRRATPARPPVDR
jgi:enoyl-CoA hydratase/carnithine racemase